MRAQVATYLLAALLASVLLADGPVIAQDEAEEIAMPVTWYDYSSIVTTAYGPDEATATHNVLNKVWDHVDNFHGLLRLFNEDAVIVAIVWDVDTFDRTPYLDKPWVTEETVWKASVTAYALYEVTPYPWEGPHDDEDDPFWNFYDALIDDFLDHGWIYGEVWYPLSNPFELPEAGEEVGGAGGSEGEEEAVDETAMGF